MPFYYSNPKRQQEPNALTDIEVFHLSLEEINNEIKDDDRTYFEAGWYWWNCFPGCLPDGEMNGVFATEAEALADARERLDQ